MSATVATIKAGLHTAFATVLNDPKQHKILSAPPTALHLPITLFTELDRFDRGESGAARGQVVAMRYFFNHFLFIRLQDTSAAEDDIDTLVNPLCAAIDADSRLGGLLESGMARIAQGETGYLRVNGTEYRVLTLVSDVLHKFAYRTAGL